MNNVANLSSPKITEAVSTAAATPDFTKPVVRPKKGAFKLFKEVLNHGGPGYLQFAITNICNADCGFCGFARSKFDPKARRSVTLPEARDEMQRHLRGEKEKFGCLGGHKYFYLDWNLDLYRGHFWETPMCKVYDWDDSKLIRNGCTRCMIDCYRDPSVLQYFAISTSDAYNNLKKGRLGAAAKNIFDSRNLTSI